MVEGWVWVVLTLTVTLTLALTSNCTEMDCMHCASGPAWLHLKARCHQTRCAVRRRVAPLDACAVSRRGAVRRMSYVSRRGAPSDAKWCRQQAWRRQQARRAVSTCGAIGLCSSWPSKMKTIRSVFERIQAPGDIMVFDLSCARWEIVYCKEKDCHVCPCWIKILV